MEAIVTRARSARCWLVISALVLLALFPMMPSMASDFCRISPQICYPTLDEAQDALRVDSELAPAGQFLEHVSTSIINTNPGTASYRFEVPPRAPATASAAMYFAHLGGYGQGQFNCQSAVPGSSTHCYDEQDLLLSAIEHLEETLSNESRSCTVTAETVAYDYTTTGTTSLDGAVRFGSKMYLPVTYSCSDGQQGSSLLIEIFKQYQITCEPGLTPGGTAPNEDVGTAALCRSDAESAVYGPLANGGQVASCRANPNPCHPTTGDKSREETDFVFAGRPFTRFYHSKRQFRADVTLGAGWSHSFSDRLIENTQWMSGDGTVETFANVAFSDRYYGVNSVDTILDRLSSSSPRYRLRTQDGEVREFNNDRRLTAIRTPGVPQHDVNLQYDADGRLSRAVDIHGRALTFLYRYGRLWRIVQPDGAAVTYTYDEENNLVAVERADGTSRIYHYGEPSLAPSVLENNLTGITDESASRYASFGYDAVGRVTSSVLHADGGAVETTFLNYGVDNTATVTTANGETRTYTTQPGFYRRLAQVTDSAGASANTYHADGRLSSVTSRNGSTTTYAFTGAFLSQRIEAGGTLESRANAYQRDSNGYLSEDKESKVESGGSHVAVRINRFVRDATGRLLYHCLIDPSVSGAEGYTCGSLVTPVTGVRQTSYTYCSQSDVTAGTCPLVGLLRSVDGARTDVPDVMAYEYRMSNAAGCETAPSACQYRKGDLWKVTDALGKVIETLGYDGAGRPVSVTDPNGIVTDYEYHARGWLTATKLRGTNDATDSDDLITRIEYWPTGLVKKVIQPDGAFVTYGYDAAHRLTTIGDNAGNTLTYTLDNAGNRIREETRDNGSTLRRTLSRLYNQLGQLATQADAGDNPTDYTYDPNGNLETVTDPLGRETSNDYDPLNRLVRTLQDVGGIEAETRFEYDALDHLTKVTDPKGLATHYTYNAFGDLLQLDSPDTGTATYTYDSAGNRTSQTDARGVTTTYGYDALNRLVGVGYPDASRNLTYLYDTPINVCPANENFQKGRLGRIRDAAGSTILRYCYDRFGNMVRKHQVTNGKTLVLQYTYTKGGQLASVIYPDGAVVDYVRDAQGRVTQVGAKPGGGVREVLLNNVTHYPFGPVAGWGYHGRQMIREHDLDYRPKTIRTLGPDGLDLGYGYDAAGNLTTLHTADLAEPPRARLDYDALGRLTAFRDGPTGAAIESYAYDATGNRTGFTNAGGVQPYAYPVDSHRLSSVGGVSRTYDAAGNTTAIGPVKGFVYDDANRLAQVTQGGTVTMNYAYNGRGERARRFNATEDVYTLYDEAGRWLGDYDAANVPTQQAIWLDDLPVGLFVRNALGVQRARYIEPDALGTPRVVYNHNVNKVAWTWDLASEAFGASPPNQDPDGDGVDFVLDMRFPGQRYDAASGLNYNYFRDYEPGTGRYSQSDPIGLAGGVSTFGYVNADPLGMIDPYGLEGVGPWTRPPPPDPSVNIAWAVLRKTYSEMLQKNVRGTDQYFHCLAACRATKASGNPGLVLDIMQRKEYRDYALNIFGQYGEKKLTHEEMVRDMARDIAVNRRGATCPPNVDCGERCSQLLDQLPLERRKYMLEYRPDWRAP